MDSNPKFEPTAYSNPYTIGGLYPNDKIPPIPPEIPKKQHKIRNGLLIAVILCMMGFTWFIGYSVGGEAKSSGSLAQLSPVDTQATATAGSLQTLNFNSTATAISKSGDTQAKASYDSGYQAGYSQGKQDGYTNGYHDGQLAQAGGQNNSYTQGYSDGVAAAQSKITAAYNQGKTDGYNNGYNDGYSAGKQDGYNAGYNDGYSKGKTDGYNSGYTDGENAEYSYLVNWIQTNCTNHYGYYYVYFNGGRIYCG